MDSALRDLLHRLEAAGVAHDAAETDHSRKLLNLERATAEAIAVLLAIAQPRAVLEIGTSNGYSTIWLAATVAAWGGRVVSIERDARKQGMARANLSEAGLLQHVDLRLGDATEVAAALSGPFDCILFDADRVSAPAQLDLLLPKLSLRALLLADNATSHPDQIAGYLARVARLKNAPHVVLPVGKGLSVATVFEA